MDLSSLGHIANLLTGLTTFFAVVFSLIQWIKANKIKRSEFLESIVKRLREDNRISKVMYMVEYQKGWYDGNFHNGGSNEKNVDVFLSFLNYIAYLRKHKIITDNEFRIVSYEMKRACKSEDVKHYLWNIYHFSIASKASCSFQELIDYGMETKDFDADFLTNETKYDRFL